MNTRVVACARSWYSVGYRYLVCVQYLATRETSAPPSASGSDDDLPMGILLGVAGGGGLLLAVLLAALATCMRSRRLKKLANKPPQFVPATPTAAVLARTHPAPPKETRARI